MKEMNEYANLLRCKTGEHGSGPELYTLIPKAVLAAVAVSKVTTGGDWPDKAVAGILAEWWALYDAGIVPQKPPAQTRPHDEWEQEIEDRFYKASPHA